jgi:hypothetical protein
MTLRKDDDWEETMNKHLVKLNLHLFDGDGGGFAAASDGAAPASAPEAEQNIVAEDGMNNSDLAEGQDGGAEEAQQKPGKEAVPNKDAEFEKLIKGDYKDIFNKRVQKIIDARFKEFQTLKAKVEKYEKATPALELMAKKYGVDPDNVDKLVENVVNDDEFYEDEAIKLGVDVETAKKMIQLQRENEQFKRAMEDQQRREEANRQYQDWQRQAEELRKTFPNFDLDEEAAREVSGPQFIGMLMNGIPVATAYKAIHADEIIGGVAQYAAQTVQQKVVNDIKARGQRPPENGAGGIGAAQVKPLDPSKMSRKEREELEKQAFRGIEVRL